MGFRCHVRSDGDAGRERARRPPAISTERSELGNLAPLVVMPGLVPAIHCHHRARPTEMPGTSPGITDGERRGGRFSLKRTVPTRRYSPPA